MVLEAKNNAALSAPQVSLEREPYRLVIQVNKAGSDPNRQAHINGIESFPFFATAVLLAEFRLGPQRLIDELAVLFLIVRIAYVFTYLGDRPTLRTILWNIGFAINVGIFFMPAIRGFLPA